MSFEEKSAVVLFAHGSRDPLWHKPIEAVAREMKKNDAGTEVRCAYLELSTPDLSTVCDDLASAGFAHITVVPMFLGVGRHAREDLPLLVEQTRVKHPMITFVLRVAVGEDPRLIQLLARIASE